MNILIDIPYINDKKLNISGDDNDGILKYSLHHNSFSFYLQKLVIDISIKNNNNFVVLNAGANLGLVCLPISFFCKKIYAFEPLANTFAYLRKNIEINQITNIESHQFALSDTCGFVKMEPYGWDKTDTDSGHSVVIDRLYESQELYEPKPNTNIIEIESKTIDSYIFDQLDMLLLDTEGYETFVIDGAINTIHNHKPYIIIEHEIGHIQCRKMTSESIVNKIINLGYNDVSIIIQDHRNYQNYNLLPLKYNRDGFLEILDIYPCVDLLFTPDNRKI